MAVPTAEIREARRALEVLRQRVTSKGGTTERGIASMEADGVKRAVASAVRAATERARELGDALGRD